MDFESEIKKCEKILELDFTTEYFNDNDKPNDEEDHQFLCSDNFELEIERCNELLQITNKLLPQDSLCRNVEKNPLERNIMIEEKDTGISESKLYPQDSFCENVEKNPLDERNIIIEENKDTVISEEKLLSQDSLSENVERNPLQRKAEKKSLAKELKRKMIEEKIIGISEGKLFSRYSSRENVERNILEEKDDIFSEEKNLPQCSLSEKAERNIKTAEKQSAGIYEEKGETLQVENVEENFIEIIEEKEVEDQNIQFKDKKETSVYLQEDLFKNDYLTEEKEDIINPEWDKVKCLNTTEERYEQVRQCWKSRTIPDPNKNLTFSSFRKKHFKSSAFDTKLIRKRKRTKTSSEYERKTKRLCTYFVDKDIKSAIEKQYSTDIHSFNQKMETLQERKKETFTFFNFYKGLNDSGDPTILTEKQFQELKEIDNIYQQFNYYYNSEF